MKKIYSHCLATLSAASMLFAVGCVDPAPVPTPPTPPEEKILSIKVEEDQKLATINSAVIVVEVTEADRFEYAYYAMDARPADAELEWTNHPVTADGKYSVEIKDLKTNITSTTKYTFEAKAYKVDSVSKPATCNFQTEMAAPVMVSDVKVSARTISAVAKLITGHCDAYSWIIVPKADYEDGGKDMFLKDLKDGYGDLVKEDAILKTESWSPCSPEKDYVIAIQPLLLGEDGKFKEFVGEIIETEVTTGTYELNQCEAAVVLALDESSITYAGVKYTATRADATVGGIFQGAVTKAKLGAKTIEDYIAESSWFFALNNFEQENYQAFRSFNDEENEYESNFSLESNTEYVVFVVAADTDGFVGKVSFKEVTTKPVTFDSPATVTVNVVGKREEGSNFGEVRIDFKDGCEKVAFLHAKRGDIDLDSARKDLVRQAADQWGDFWTKDDEQPITLRGVEINTDYDLYVLPITADGKFGEVVHKEFSGFVSLINWDENLTLTAVQKGELTEVELNTYEGTFTIAYSGSVKGFDYGSVDSEMFPKGDPTAKECAQKYYDSGWMYKADAGVKEYTLEFTNYNEEAEQIEYVVFTPYGDGTDKGIPVMIKLTIPKGKPIPPKPDTDPDKPKGSRNR